MTRSSEGLESMEYPHARSRVRLVMSVALLAVCTAAACTRGGETPPPAQPSVLLITVDTQRPDRLGCYGHPTNRTPAVDRLAREGTLFEHAYCDIPWTTGSMASVMTGTFSSTHGLQLPMHRLRDESQTLAEVLAANGYQTAAIIGSFPLDSVYRLDQGFEVYDDEFTLPILSVPGKEIERVESYLDDDLSVQHKFLVKKLTNDAYRTDDEVTAAAVRWLDDTRDPGRPFLLWVHYFGPHERINLAKSIPEQDPEVIAAYDGDVEATDRAVGGLLDHLRASGLIDSTLVIYHADHAQSLGENQVVGHGTMLYDSVARIPLVIRYPRRFPAGARRADLAQNVDIWPTVLATLEIDDPGTGPGRSLIPVAAETAPPETLVYLETYVPTITQRVIRIPEVGTILGPVARNGLRTEQWKLIVSRVVGPCKQGERVARKRDGSYYLEDPTDVDEARCRSLELVELFAAGGDEERPANAAARHPTVVASLRRMLETLRTDRPKSTTFTLSPEEEAKLRSLGYLR